MTEGPPPAAPSGQGQKPAGPRRVAVRVRVPITATSLALILILIGFFLAQLWLGQGNPEEPLTLFRLGGNSWVAMLDGDLFRLGSSSFLHTGFVHLLLNCWTLWLMMVLVERSFGPVTALGIYALSVVGSCALTNLWSMHGGNAYLIGVGASGGIFGLWGAYAALWLRVRKLLTPEASKFTSRKLLIVLGLIVFTDGAGALAFGDSSQAIEHLGGIAVGLCAGLLSPLAIKPRRLWSRPAQILLVLATFALASMEGAAISRAGHPHSRHLRGDGVSAEAPWMLVPWPGNSGVAVSPGEIGLRTRIFRSATPLQLPANAEAMPIGDRTWLRAHEKGEHEGEELLTLTAKEGAGSVQVHVLCDTATCRGELMEQAAIDLARNFRVGN